MNYTKPLEIYRYTVQSDLRARPEDIPLYLQQELRNVARSNRSLADALVEVRTGTSDGSTITLADTGVKPGRYENPVITVMADGRIATISAGDKAVSPFPRFGTKGQVLSSDGANGVLWQDIPSPIPEAGSVGQVLSKTATGTAWTTIEPPVMPPALIPADSDDMVLTPVGPKFTYKLRPTGISPGTYTNPTVTCDGSGRITAISEGLDDAYPVPTAFCSESSAGISDTWRVMVDLGFNGVFDSEVAFLINGEEVTGTQTRSGAFLTAVFPEPVDVRGIKLTAVTGPGSMFSGRVQQPDNMFWTTAFDLPRQAEWTPGETRYFTIGPSISLTGDVTGNGSLEIVTKLTPTGVKPGTYKTADVTVAADGRVTAIKAGVATGGSDPNAVITHATWQSPNGSLWDVVMSDTGSFVITASDAYPNAIQAEDGSTLMAENGTDYISF
jgi:hypothetical protein